MKPICSVMTLLVLLLVSEVLMAKEPSWTGAIVKRGEDREKTQAMPIESRPYRPFHFYGNTVRRINYRGEVLPRPRDFVNGANAWAKTR